MRALNPQSFSLGRLMAAILAISVSLATCRAVGWERSMQVVGLLYILAPTIATIAAWTFGTESQSRRRLIGRLTVGVITCGATTFALALLDWEGIGMMILLTVLWIPQYYLLAISYRLWQTL